MQNNAEQILSSLRETIWVLNNQSVSVNDFSDGFKNYCFKLLQNFDGIAFNAEETIKQNKTIAAHTAVHLNKLLQEAVQNIIKHAAATIINYTISSDDKIVIILSDNGKGFDINAAGKGNGLENMQWRAEKAGYHFNINTSAAGTVITVEENE